MLPPIPNRAPWPFGGVIPQRFGSRYKRYQELGGLVDVTSDAEAYAGEEALRDVERFVFLSLTFDQIRKEGVEGDFAELGVYQGSTAAVLARHARRLNRKIYLLDTYEGFKPADFSALDEGRRIAFTDTSLEAVRARIGDENTSFIKGYFPQTAEQLPADGRYCLVHIDADLYAPIIAGLEYFYPRLTPGGFLIIHDYGSLVWEGAEKAVDQFFADKPESVIPIPDNSGSVVIRKLRRPGEEPDWITHQQRLTMGEWHSVANGQHAAILTNGWSAPEPWGTWGVGSCHEIRLISSMAEDSAVGVDIDAHAFVWDGVAGRTMKIRVNDGPFQEVVFNKSSGVTSIVLEPIWPCERSRSIVIQFQPLTSASPREVIPSSQDTRRLGLALHRIRIRPATGHNSR